MRDAVIIELDIREDGSFFAVVVLRAAISPGLVKGQALSADPDAPADELEALGAGLFVERVNKTGVIPKGGDENLLRDLDEMLLEFQAEVAKKYQPAPASPSLLGAARASNGDWARKDGSKIARKEPVPVDSLGGPSEAALAAAAVKIAKPRV